MATIQGTNVAAPIVPGSTLDVFPTHDAQYGRGGFRAVVDVAARDAIPSERKSAGMVVRTISTGVNWVLAPDLITWTSDSVATFENLQGVSITSKTDNDIIAYDAQIGVWKNKPQEYLVDGGNW